MPVVHDPNHERRNREEVAAYLVSDCTMNSEIGYTHSGKNKERGRSRALMLQEISLLTGRIELLSRARRLIRGYYSNRRLQRESQHLL